MIDIVRDHWSKPSSVAVEAWWWRGSLREGLAAYGKVWVPERAQKLLAQLQQRPQSSGDVRMMGQPLRTAACVEWSGPEPMRQAVLCCKQQIWRHGFSLEPRGLWIGLRHQTLRLLHHNTVLLWFDCDCELILPSWSKEVFTSFFFISTGAHSWLWTFKETFEFRETLKF